MELIPATLLKTEYIALKTELYLRYRNGLDPSNQASLWSFAVDTVEEVINTHMDVITSELAAGRPFPPTIWQNLLQQLVSSGKHDGNPQEQAIDSDHNNGLIIMSSVQAYLERMPFPFMIITETNLSCSCLKTICRHCFQLC